MADNKTNVSQQSTEEVEAPKELSQREMYDRDFAAMNPDLNMEDEEAVYGARNKMLDKLKRYDSSTKRLKETMKKSPMLSEAIGAISESDGDFDLLQWLSSAKGVDIKKALEDPDYAKSITDAFNKSIADKAQQNEADEKARNQFNEKATASLNAIYDWDSGRKVSAEQTKKNLQQVTAEIEAYIQGDYLPLYQKLSKGTRYDEDMATATERGRKEGLNTKVNEKLRSMPSTPSRSGGRQQAIPQPKPQKAKKTNPYIDEEDDF